MAIVTACWKKGLLTFTIYYALLFVGAAVMMYLEADGLTSQKEFNATKELDNFFTSKFNLSFNDSSLKEIIKLSSSLSSKMVSREKQEWKKTISWKAFYKWRYFTHVTLTTVGFGDIVPETDGGKIFLMFYASIGIPVSVIMTGVIGFLLSDFISRLITLFEKKILQFPTVKNMELKTCVVLVLLLVGWMMMGVGITQKMMKWSWVEALYSCFVVYSTIGYGDYAIDYDKVVNYLEPILWFTNTALAIVTGLLEAISRATQISDEECGSKTNPSGISNEMVDVSERQEGQKHIFGDSFGDSFGRTLTNKVIPVYD